MTFNEVHYIRFIEIKSLASFIRNRKLNKDDTIRVSLKCFDDIALNYRETYEEGIELPFFLDGVLIEPDMGGYIKNGYLGIIKDDINNPSRLPIIQENILPIETVYRCGWCGKIVDNQGDEHDRDTVARLIKLIERYGDDIVERVNGRNCCYKFNP